MSGDLLGLLGYTFEVQYQLVILGTKLFPEQYRILKTAQASLISNKSFVTVMACLYTYPLVN